jgi:hypothetical protein
MMKPKAAALAFTLMLLAGPAPAQTTTAPKGSGEQPGIDQSNKDITKPQGGTVDSSSGASVGMSNEATGAEKSRVSKTRIPEHRAR